MSINSKAKLELKIKKKLSRIAPEKLEEINDIISFLLQKTSLSDAKPLKLEGTWENQGLENILDLESELKDARQELSNQILQSKLF